MSSARALIGSSVPTEQQQQQRPGMADFSWLLWTLCCGLAAGGPVQLLTWPAGRNPLVRADVDESARPTFLRLPVFQQAPGPQVARELFAPARRLGPAPGSGPGPVPTGLSALLFPQTPQRESPPFAGARPVEFHCGANGISVRVDRLQMRAWTVPARFRLGSCPASQVGPRFLYFHYGLMECGGESQVVGNQLMYTFTLFYTPPPQGYVVHAVPLNLPLHCHYNRFHYSYKVGFRPQVQHSSFMKGMTSKRSFSLTVYDAQWKPLPPGYWFVLGEPVYFVAQTGPLLAGERLYVDSCYATSSKDPNSRPRVDIISNYGCMMDSRREGSGSLFLSGGGSVLKFSVDTFVFGEVSQLLFLHCSMSVDITTSDTSKSCNYNKAASRWAELLVTAPSMCSCCDSICADNQDSTKNLVSSPGWLTRQEAEEIPKMKVAPFQAAAAEEEEGDWETQGGQSEDRMDELPEKPKSFSPRTKLGPAEEKEEAILKRTPPLAPSQGGGGDEEGEMEAAVLEKAGGQLTGLTADGISASDQAGPEENEIFPGGEEAPDAKKGSVSSLSSDSGTSTPADGPGEPTITATNSSSGSNGGSAEKETTIDAVLDIKLCSDGECSSRNAALMDEPDAGDDAVDTSPSSWRVGPHAEAGRNGSVGDSSVHESPPIDGSGDSKTGSLWSEQVDSAEMLMADEPDVTPEWDGEKTLRSLQIRESESDQWVHAAESIHPVCADGSFGDCDAGDDDDEANHHIQFTGEVETRKEAPRFFASASSARSEEIHGEGAGHSATVMVVTSPRGSRSGPVSDGEWPEVLQGWLAF